MIAASSSRRAARNGTAMVMSERGDDHERDDHERDDDHECGDDHERDDHQRGDDP